MSKRVPADEGRGWMRDAMSLGARDGVSLCVWSRVGPTALCERDQAGEVSVEILPLWTTVVPLSRPPWFTMAYGP